MNRGLRSIALFLAVVVLAISYRQAPNAPAVADNTGLSALLRDAEPVLFEAGTVVYYESLHKLGPLLLDSPTSSGSLSSWDLSAFDYRMETWLLLGQEGQVSRQYYRKVSPNGAVLEEDFRDAAKGVEYNYIPLTGKLWEFPWAGESLRAGTSVLEEMVATGYRLTGREEVAGSPVLVFERVSPLPRPVSEKPLCLVPGYGFSIEGPPKEVSAEPPDIPQECPEASKFQAMSMMDRIILKVAPLGIPMGSEIIYVEKESRKALITGSRLTVWETFPASEAPPQLFQWQPPSGGAEQGLEPGRESYGRLGLLDLTPSSIGGDIGVLTRWCNDDQDYPYPGWWIWWAACIDSPWPYYQVAGYASQGGSVSSGSFDYLYVSQWFRAKYRDSPSLPCYWLDWINGWDEEYNATFVEAWSPYWYPVSNCPVPIAQTASFHWWQDESYYTTRDGYIER